MYESERTPVIITIIGILCLLFFIAFLLFVFTPLQGVHQLLEPLFAVMNPFTAGVYSLGCGMLLTLMYARGRFGLTLGAALCICYLIMAAVSLVALMRMSSFSSLLMYGPNVIIVYAGIMIMVRRGKSRR